MLFLPRIEWEREFYQWCHKKNKEHQEQIRLLTKEYWLEINKRAEEYNVTLRL